MRTVTLIALIFLAAPFVRVAVQGTEVRQSHWPNGNVRSQIEARRDLQGRMIRDGRAELYHEDGTPSARGNFEDDHEQGRWTWFSPEGRVVAICDYDDGVGLYRDLLPDGRVLREGTMVGIIEVLKHLLDTAYTDEDPPRSQSVRFEHGEIVEGN